MKLKLYLVTGNKHKYEEAKRIFNDTDIDLLMAPLGKFEIQSDDLKAIAWKAALHAYKILRTPIVVDDSGIFIDALNGFPGVYSSYVFRTLGNNGILKLMTGIKNRRACFKTSLAVIVPPLDTIIEDEVCGEIAEKPVGTLGFGFDPIFIPEGEKRTFAQMDIDEKNRYSHRARAFRRLVKWLRDNFML